MLEVPRSGQTDRPIPVEILKDISLEWCILEKDPIKRINWDELKTH